MGYHGNGTTSVCIFHYYRNHLGISEQYISQPLTSIRKPGRYSDPSHLRRALPHPLRHRWRNHHLHAFRTTFALLPAFALAAMRTHRDSTFVTLAAGNWMQYHALGVEEDVEWSDDLERKSHGL